MVWVMPLCRKCCLRSHSSSFKCCPFPEQEREDHENIVISRSNVGDDTRGLWTDRECGGGGDSTIVRNFYLHRLLPY